jgi:hypothetical protein
MSGGPEIGFEFIICQSPMTAQPSQIHSRHHSEWKGEGWAVIGPVLHDGALVENGAFQNFDLKNLNEKPTS